MESNEIEEIISEYFDGCCTIRKIEKGYACNKWLINNSRNEKIFLKEMKNISDNRLKFINYVQTVLRKNTPKILKSKSGTDFIKKDDFKYVAYEYIEGNSFEKHILTDDYIYRLGRALGILHKELSKIKISETEDTTYLKIGTDNDIELESMLVWYENNELNEFADVIRYKIEIKRKLQKNIDVAKSKLSKQVVHGDFYIDNLLVRNGSVIITDFDQTCVFYKMYEVMRGMMMISFDDASSCQDNLNRTKFFLNGYKKENKLEHLDLAIDLYSYTLANSMYCMRKEDYLNENRKTFALRRYKMLKWIYENKGEITNLIDKEDINI